MIGDTPYDVEAALRTGIEIIGLRSGGWSDRELTGAIAVYAVAAEVLTAIRKEKALRKVSLRAEVERVLVRDTEERLALLDLVERDLRQAGNITALDTEPAGAFAVETVLAAPPTS